jgi:hypothetical protein
LIDIMILSHNAQEASQLEDMLDLTSLLKKLKLKSFRKSMRMMSGPQSRSSTPSFITKSRSRLYFVTKKENA